MQVQELECQIAQAQMGRYLSGDALSPETIEDLEAHFARCEACQEAIRQRRGALEKLLAESGDTPKAQEIHEPALAAVSIDEPTKVPAAFSGKQPIGLPEINLMSESRPDTPVDFLRRNSKTLGYSALLAVTLVAMSFFIREPTKLFGERAMAKTETVQPTSPPSVVPPVDSTTQNKPMDAPPTDRALDAASDKLDSHPLDNVDSAPVPAVSNDPVSDFALDAAMSVLGPTPHSPEVESAPAPKVVAPKPALPARPAQATVRRIAHRKPGLKTRAKAPAVTGVRVYSPNGKPLSNHQ